MVIKPHVVSDGYIGQVIDSILAAGFEVSALEMFWLDRPSTEVTHISF
jgi:nucleoside-diphosphate kinase